MSTKTTFPGYTPQLSQESIYILRRLAWVYGKPMTKTLDQLIAKAVQKVNIKTVCNACKGNKDQCTNCIIREGVASVPTSTTPSNHG